MSIIQTIEQDIQAEFAKLAGIDGKILAQVLPMLQSASGALLAQVLPIAEQIVVSLATDGTKTGLEKLQTAIPQVVSLVEAAGIKAGTGAVVTAIQIAAANLPKSATPAA